MIEFSEPRIIVTTTLTTLGAVTDFFSAKICSRTVHKNFDYRDIIRYVTRRIDFFFW